MKIEKQNIVIINYGAGNIKSIQFALKRLGYEGILSEDESVIRSANKVIFPGVGEASSAMQKLRSTGLDKVIPSLTQPVLGICLGMQLMCTSSKEGNTKGLGIFNVDVVKFSSEKKVPQIGWNTIENLKTKLFSTIAEASYMYTVHSYYAPSCTETIATTTYGISYSAALKKDNFYGVQFHPEKSSATGEVVLKNFLNLNEPTKS
ncbi:imidazole glycerol phosphate synthase subunit HisH [Jejudonia soesokkakensis]|uniref:Imidazole glycerol phosphate synthase subunit HisH n=1 Tax=Jejudonia soesokkakensis TaxID=1323432 RepID=A0ABW2MR93_9FLAO